MKITVVTVVKNARATLRDTLMSVRDQDYPDVEHIVVDGGSSDGTIELLQEAENGVARLIIAPDGGVYEGFNRGLAAATGDVVGFLNGDDVFEGNGALSRIAAALESGEANAVYGDLLYVQTHDLSREVRYWQSGLWSRQRVSDGWMPPHPTLYLRRDFADAVGPFDSSYRIAGDYEYFLRMFRRPDLRMTYIPTVLVRMRMGGMSNWPPINHFHKWREDLRAIREHGVGGVWTLVAKSARKLPQLLNMRRSATRPSAANSCREAQTRKAF